MCNKNCDQCKCMNQEATKHMETSSGLKGEHWCRGLCVPVDSSYFVIPVSVV